MKRNRKSDRRPTNPVDGLRRMARPFLEANVFSQADFEPFAQRMTAATADDQRGQVVNDYLRFAIGKMEAAGKRMMGPARGPAPEPKLTR